MQKILVVLAISFGFLSKMAAQVLPPDFRCVRSDTLYWDLPTNNCGPFVGYEIWVSASPTGPFTLHTTITNQSQGSYGFPNPSGGQWYFYLLSNYNCPGQTAIPSDTIDNRPPLVSPLETVSVENGLAVLTWEPSPSPEVVAYVIYRQTSTGAIPVDTVYNGYTYTDPDSDPQAGPESYFVNALDPCGNSSIFDVKHTSIFVAAVVVPCRQSVVLDWNLYEGHTSGIAEQQVWLSINGGPLTQAGDAGPSASSFEVPDVVDGATYCFEIRAVESGSGSTAKSSQFCLPVDIIQSAKGMLLENVSLTAANEVELTWNWDPLAELASAAVLRSNDNLDYQTIFAPTATPPLTALNNYLDATSGAASGKVFYKIQTLDNCDSVLTTNYGSSIYLAAAPLPGNLNQLNWTAFDIETADVASYLVYRVVGGNDTQLAEVSSSTLIFDDLYVPTSLEEAQACYYIKAKTEVTSPNGQVLAYESRSNTACIEEEARIFVPNAFVPEGINQEFRPVLGTNDVASYELKVFDRYGQEVFKTNLPEAGWDGRKNDRNLAQGVYAYIIKLTQASGKVTEKRGTVLLIR